MELSSFIDHTILRPDAKLEEIEQLARETLEFQFKSACIHPYWVRPMAKAFPNLPICTVINFPLGMQTVSLHEAEKAVLAGAIELDFVVSHPLVQAKAFDALRDELLSYRRIFPEICLKLIIETCQRTDEEIITLTQLCREVEFDFIKTSTGFAKEGATLYAVALMAKYADGKLGVKASGGIKSFQSAKAMIDAGATRIGTSSGISILREAGLIE